MKNLFALFVAAAAFVFAAPLSAQTSPLFTGDTSDIWVIDPETGQVVGYDAGTWVSSVDTLDLSSVPLGATDVVLINALASSSVQMTPGQPAISLAGLGSPGLSIGAAGDGGREDLVLVPEAGSFTATTPVQIGVSSTVLSAEEHTLVYSLTDTQSGSVVRSDSIVLPAGAGAEGENGYFSTAIYLVESGDYSLDVQLLRGVSLKATVNGSYTLQIPPGEERRDSDGDGIPDVVENDIGLDPLEDDWTADLDGDGWSEFDEWLRRFCLDPVTRLPNPSDPSCTDAAGRPVDSDEDNWSDFDEILRGTNPNDPEPDLSAVLATPASLQEKPGVGSPLPVSAPTVVLDAALCTDGTTFDFRIEFYAEADDSIPSDIIFRIGADAAAFTGGISKQRVQANWDESGNYSRGVIPEVIEFISGGVVPPDRWQVGPIQDFTVAQPERFNWVVTGSIPVGSEPFQPGDLVNEVAIRSFVSGDRSVGDVAVSGNLADCAVLAPPPPPPPVDGPEFGELEAQLRLRFKDFPAATRLYEVEYLLDNGVLEPPVDATLTSDQVSLSGPDAAYDGVVVQSLQAVSDNIAGVNVVVTASELVSGTVIMNVWRGALRTGELVVSQALDVVELEPGELAALPYRFEARPTQPGETLYLELRKQGIQAAASNADVLPGGEIVERDGTAVSGIGDLMFEIFSDASFANGTGGRRFTMQWWTLGAAGIDGRSSYDATSLVSDAEIAAVGLAPGDIADRRRLSVVESRFNQDRLPPMRLPAGSSQVVAVVDRQVTQAGPSSLPPDDYSRIYKHWFARRNDVTPVDMLEEQGAGNWTTPEEWRNEFIAYLLPRLVVANDPTLNEASTLTVSLVEAALAIEADLDGSSANPLLADLYQPVQPVYVREPGPPEYVKPIPETDAYALSWEQDLAKISGGQFTLDDLVAALPPAFASNAELSAVADFLLDRFRAGVPGTRSDAYLAASVRRSFDDNCFVRADVLPELQADEQAWSDFFDRCPVYFDETGLSQRLEEDRERGYLLRLAALPGAVAEITSDPTLLARSDDSDLDGLLNTAEIRRPLGTLTLPWLTDTDNDIVADGDDQCPLDPLNECSANPVLPVLTLADDVVVFEPASGADAAIISLQLDRIHERSITVCYEALATATDSATGGVDFDVVNNCIEIEPGQQGALITVPVQADTASDAGETFTVRITSVDGAAIGDDGVVVVTVNDPNSSINDSPVFTSASSATATAGQTSANYTARAIDVDNDALTFSIDGGADAALLSIDATTGQLGFLAAPDFFTPADADGDNDYELRLGVVDGRGGADALDLVVSVVDGGAGGLKLEFVYPTPSANLGSGSATTSVVIRASDRDGSTLSSTDIESLTINDVTAEAIGGGLWRSTIPLSADVLHVDVTARAVDGRSGATGTQFGNETLALGVAGIAVEDSGRLLVVDDASHSLLSVDTVSGARQRLLPVPEDGVRDITWDAGTSSAWLLANSKAGLFEATLDVERPREVLPVRADLSLQDARALALDAEGRRLWVLESSRIHELDLASRQHRTMPLPGGIADPRFLEFSARSRELLLLDAASDDIIALDTAGNLSRRIHAPGLQVDTLRSVALDDARGRILLAGSTGDIGFLNLADGRWLKRERLGELLQISGAEALAVRIDGERIYLAEGSTDSLLALSDDFTTTRLLSHQRVGHDTDDVSLRSVDGFAYSAAGDRLLLRSGSSKRVIAVDVGGGHRQFATFEEEREFARLGTEVEGVSTGGIDPRCEVCAIDPAGQSLYLFDDEAQLVRVELASGQRHVVSGTLPTGGVPFIQPAQLSLDVDNRRAFVYDEAAAAVIVVQLDSGERALMSK